MGIEKASQYGTIGTLLADESDRREFVHAVESAFKEIYGSKGGPYNIDTMARLATALDCHHYAVEHMRGKPRFPDRQALLSYAIQNIAINGMVMEFGVFSGHTINQIADGFPDKTVYGFDSFQGLPEDWTSGQRKGHFARESLPKVRDNVELVVGWFDRSLPDFLESHAENVSFLHIDCDVYSSTQTVLAQLRDRIVAGTIIVFDEYFNYPDWRFHEYLAFVERNRIRYEYLGLFPCYEQVAVRILDKGEPL